MSVPDHCSVVSGQDPNWIRIQRYGAWIRIKIGVAFQDPNLNWGLDVDPNEGKLQDPDPNTCKCIWIQSTGPLDTFFFLIA